MLFALLVHANLSGQHADSCNINIRGIVIDSLDRTPLELTRISLVGKENINGTTDKKGYFMLKGLCPGNIELHVSHMSCEHLHLTLNLQKDTTLLIYIKHTEQVIPGVKILAQAGKSEKMNALNNRQIELNRGVNIAQLMQELGGVNLLKTGSNVSKPVVNGLHGNRVVIVNNGIRQEGQNWGMEHAPEIDAFLASEIELIKGAESLRYGADGIGGILLVNPPSLFREKENRLSGEVNLIGFSNGRGGIASGFIGGKISEKLPIYWRAQMTEKKAGNTYIPSYYLSNTGIQERNHSINLGYKKRSFSSEIFYSAFTNKIGIYTGSHIGNLSDLEVAMNSDKPLYSSDFKYQIDRPYQLVKHRLLKFKNEVFINPDNRIELSLSYQNNHREEYDIKRSQNSYEGPSFDYYINTYMGDAVWHRNDFHKLNMKFGIYGIYQSNAYTGRFFIPGFYQKGIAQYFIAQKQQRDQGYEFSIRNDVRYFEAFLWKNNILDIRKRTYVGPTYLFRYHWNSKKTGKIGITNSSTWRPPAPNELYSDGLHQGLASIEKGDPNLSPERAFNLSIDHIYESKKWMIESEVYVKYIRGFINLVPGLEPQLTIRGAFPVFNYVQTDAVLKGLNYRIKYKLNKEFSMALRGNILNGNDLKNKTYLNQMPPYNGSFNLHYEHNQLSIGINTSYALNQWRYVENSDYKIPPKAYMLLGGDISYRLHIKEQTIRFSLSVHNALNKKYREYLNRFRYFTDEPGTNITFRILIPLNINIKQYEQKNNH